MHTIVLSSQKGGPGKTTLTWSIASAAVADGLRVLMVDLDRQQTLRTWWESRDADYPQMLAEDPAPEDLPDIIKAAREQFDLLVVDTPGQEATWIGEVMRLADLLIVPVRPSATDVAALGPTLDSIERAGVRMAFVFNQVRQGTKISGKALEAVAQHGRVIPVKIIARAVHQDSMGVSALEMKDKQARAEVVGLWQWIKEDLDGKARAARRPRKAAASLGTPAATDDLTAGDVDPEPSSRTPAQRKGKARG
jgi:chromosome partitioning protein